jgi:phage I-like protein
MSVTVEVHVRASNSAGEEVEARASVPSVEGDLRLAAYAALLEGAPAVAAELGLTAQDQARAMMARVGALSRDLSERL